MERREMIIVLLFTSVGLYVGRLVGPILSDLPIGKKFVFPGLCGLLAAMIGFLIAQQVGKLYLIKEYEPAMPITEFAQIGQEKGTGHYLLANTTSQCPHYTFFERNTGYYRQLYANAGVKIIDWDNEFKVAFVAQYKTRLPAIYWVFGVWLPGSEYEIHVPKPQVAQVR